MRASIIAPLHSAQWGAQWDISATAGENDAAFEGTVLRHFAELDAQAPSLDAGWDLALANRPALTPFLTAESLSGGALDVLVVAHPDAEAACERVEPFDQRGLARSRSSATRVARVYWAIGRGVCAFFFIGVCRRLIEPAAVYLDERLAIRFTDPTASACWRLIGLLEYHGRHGPILQRPKLLEGARSHREAGVCSQGD